MSTVKDCPACGRGFIKGKRVLFPMRDGRLVRKLVCLKCSAGAERVVTRVTAKSCMVPGCANAAHVCSHHAAHEVEMVRLNALSGAIEAVRSKIAAYRLVEAPDREYVDGKIEGLEMALEMMVQQGAKRGSS